MNELNVRIVRLEAMHVASVHAFGPSPEMEAWGKLVGWAESRGLLASPQAARIFGFNNPNPAPGSPNYGYEFWIEVPADVEAGEGAQIKAFAGGLYAVARCRGVEKIGPTWQELAAWCEDSRYRLAHHQWLEEHLGSLGSEVDAENLTLDLYCPIAE